MHQMRMSVSKEELTPGSDQMKARASKAMLRMGKQLLTPLEAANLIAGNRNELVESTSSEDDDDVFFIDVRTRQQRLDHEIIPGGVKGLTPMGSINVPLDDMVTMTPEALRALLCGQESSSGAGSLPNRRRPILLTCTAGPKSCVAWDFLTGESSGTGLAAEDVFVIDGGIRAWAGLGFPTDPVPQAPQ